jgi:cytochrome P450
VTDLKDLARIEDPQFYLNDEVFAVFARMRAEDPVFYYKPLDTYVLTKHEDIRFVNRNPAIFSNVCGIFLNDVKYQDIQADGPTLTDSFFPMGGEQIGTTDPPRHHELRRVVSPAFSARALQLMEAEIRGYCAELVDQIEPGAVTDWMELAAILPIRVGSLLIGLPDVDRDKVRYWSDELEKLGGDLTLDELQSAAAEFATLRSYILENVEAKRAAAPGEDLLSTLLEAELDDRRVSEANVVMFAMTMLAAGSDTTRALLAGMVWALAKHPDQLALVAADRSLVPGAVEEALRWVTPARAFLRTATCDTEVRGQVIQEGQHVYNMYMAANRDEDVFPRPETFDIARRENELHLAFGIGTHVCIGARLVRLEAVILLNMLLDRFAHFELAAEPVPVRHIIRNSWHTMPVVFAS